MSGTYDRRNWLDEIKDKAEAETLKRLREDGFEPAQPSKRDAKLAGAQEAEIVEDTPVRPSKQ